MRGGEGRGGEGRGSERDEAAAITLTTCQGVTVAYSSSNVEWMKAMSSMVVLVVSVSWR